MANKSDNPPLVKHSAQTVNATKSSTQPKLVNHSPGNTNKATKDSAPPKLVKHSK